MRYVPLFVFFGLIQTTMCAQTKSDNSFEIDMILVPGGAFLMGSDDGEADEKPIHSVTLSSFYIGKYEVTQKQWREVMGKDPINLKFAGCDNCPVERVSWNEVQIYLQKLNSKTGKIYRLPTEAEWEFAARGGKGSNSNTYSGSNHIGAEAWFLGNSESKTHSIGGKKANELGVYDMTGNVWEWCNDWYDDNYYSSSTSENPKGPTTGSYRVYRGGGWNDTPLFCRVTRRGDNAPSDSSGDLGFRVALSIQ